MQMAAEFRPLSDRATLNPSGDKALAPSYRGPLPIARKSRRRRIQGIRRKAVGREVAANETPSVARSRGETKLHCLLRGGRADRSWRSPHPSSPANKLPRQFQALALHLITAANGIQNSTHDDSEERSTPDSVFFRFCIRLKQA